MVALDLFIRDSVTVSLSLFFEHYLSNKFFATPKFKAFVHLRGFIHLNGRSIFVQ